MKFRKNIINDPSRKGELAAKKQLFGKNNRYAIAPVHSRFDTVGWFVWDAEKPDYKNHDAVLGYAPAIIRIVDTFEAAIAGLA